MTDFRQGENRYQSTLFPEQLEDFVSEDNAVRVIDVFVDELDLSGLGFKAEPSDLGSPAYHPATLLKIYIYGYLNQIQTSRRLEREAQRNVELMWLIGRLTPTYKTIADFRKDHGEAIRLVGREFVLLCRKLDLFTEAFVAIDGSKFKAVNNRDRNLTQAKLRRRIEQIDESIERYLSQMESADRQESEVAKEKSQRLKDKIEILKGEVKRLKKLGVRMLKAPDQQISETDPDARSMATSGRGTGVVGYNVQTAIEAKHHLIVAHEVTNQGHDRQQLLNMATQAKEAMGVADLTAVTDRGYYKSDEILACKQAGITVIVPKPMTSNNGAKGLFKREDFRYDAEANEYICPAGERAIWRFRRHESGREMDCYWSSACSNCSIKSQCTTGVHRRIKRWVHESVLDQVQERLDREPERMRVRRETAEHPFATIKSWMGSSHFLTKTLKHVSTEMSLHVLAYNMKRMMNIMGPQALMAAIRA